MLPTGKNIFLVPNKKVIVSTSGFILEEDKWELDPNLYTIHMVGPESDQSLVGLEIICSDSAGVNCVVQGLYIKVITPELILGTL